MKHSVVARLHPPAAMSAAEWSQAATEKSKKPDHALALSGFLGDPVSVSARRKVSFVQRKLTDVSLRPQTRGTMRSRPGPWWREAARHSSDVVENFKRSWLVVVKARLMYWKCHTRGVLLF